MTRNWGALLFILPCLVSAREFDVPAGEFYRDILSNGVATYPARIVCTYRFDQIRFNKDWGPGFVMTFRAQDDLKPYIQFRATVTNKDDRYVLSYLQRFEGNPDPWEISYLVVPYEPAVEIKTTVGLYGNGMVDFQTSIDGKIFTRGRILTPDLSVEQVTAHASSASGEYSCEGL